MVIGLVTTFACLGAAGWARRTVVEVFAPRLDVEVVRTVRRWLGLAPS